MSKMLRLTFLLACFLTLWTTSVTAQGSDAVLKVQNGPLPQVLRQLELKTDYRFLYINDDLKGYTFSGDLTLKDINSTMTQLLAGKPLGYTVNQQYITITKQGANTNGTYILHGKVVDENGDELPGVNIRVQGTKNYAVTGMDGTYTIQVHSGDVLRFSFIGYREEIAAVKGKKVLNVDMRPDAHTLKDVQVVAFGTQKKESVVSSITSIRPGDLKTSSSDLTTSFAGRIPGMVAWQTGGMPGAMTENEMNTKFYVRGITSFQSGANTDSLILIDGVESTKLDLARLTVEDIETFNVMKEKKEWMAEVKVLKAFVYFQLVKRYGPIILVPKNIEANASLDVMKQPRQPIDSCFNAIVSLIDDALNDGLLSKAQQLTSHQAYFNHESALALKAIVLTYAASPLFNGNSDFASFKNKNGELLFPHKYDAEKWHKAAVACDEAIKACESAGYKLVSGNSSKSTKLLNTMYDLEKRTQNPGYSNAEDIFAVKGPNTYMYYSDKLYTWILPHLKSTDYSNYDSKDLGCLAPSMKMVEMYYTDKGLPIDEDPSWDYPSRFTGMSQETDQATYDKVIPAGTPVLNLHLRREPRFYADIAADRTYFQRGPEKANSWSTDYNLLVKVYRGESFGTDANSIREDIPQNLTGYWVKKTLYSDIPGRDYSNSYVSKGSDDPFALIRLSELYFMDAEAWNEYEGPSEKVYSMINKVRERDGIPDVQDSWRQAKHPDLVNTKKGMRSIIQQKTNIEFAFEGQRYFNLLRWKKGEELGQPIYGWNIIGEDAQSFYNNWHGPIVVWNKRKFIAPRDYFHPIRTEEIQISGCKQNPGW